MKKLFFVGLMTVVLATLAWFIWSPKPLAPQISFHSLKGQAIDLQALRGKVVLVKFWATSCATCVQQMPETTAIYQTYAPRGFEVLAIAMRYDPPNYVLNFAQTHQLPFIVGLDVDGKLAEAFDHVQLTPTAFLIDKQGRILKRYLGNYDPVEFKLTLDKALEAS